MIEMKNTIEMINAKVADLVDQGMPQRDAFNAVVKRLETEYPAVFAFLISSARL